MDVELYQAFLTIDKRKVKLTKSIAKQMPILDGKARWHGAEQGLPQPEPFCKVAGHVLNQMYDWMYLVEDEVAGLGWVAAMQVDTTYAEQIVKRGGWIDKPADVPTVFL